MATLQANIASAREVYAAELAQHTAEGWETKPAGSADGEAAWCARQVAEHIAGSSGFFAMGIGRAVGVQAPPTAQFSFAGPAAAVAGTPGALDGLVGVIKQVPESALENELEFGPLGKTTLANVIGIVAYHLNDHAAQLKALRG